MRSITKRTRIVTALIAVGFAMSACASQASNDSGTTSPSDVTDQSTEPENGSGNVDSGDNVGPTNSDEPVTLTLMSYVGDDEDAFTEVFVNGFMDKHPGIKVEYRPVPFSSEMLANLRTETNDPAADVVIMDTSVANTANSEGLFSPLDPSIVTNLAHLDESSLRPNNMGAAATRDNLALIYDTNAVATPPTSWAELWNPDLAGKVAVSAPPNIVGIAFTAVVSKMLNIDYTDDISPAISFLSEKLSPGVVNWAPKPDMYTYITSGQAAIGMGWNGRSQRLSDDPANHLGVVLPDEGTVYQVNTVNLVANSPHPREAQELVNYILSPGAQESLADLMFYAPTNKNANLPQEILDRTAFGHQDKVLDFDWTWASAHNDDWTKFWQRSVIR